MHLYSRIVVLVLFSILFIATPGTAQEAEHYENAAPAEHQAHEEEHAEETEHEEHGEEHVGRPVHKNDIGFFIGLTDEHGHASEPTLGIDYRREVAHRLGIGALLDYAGGDLRNMIIGASLTWFPVGRFYLTAAPGIEFHRGRGPTIDCGCGHKSEDPEQADLNDEDARYFVFRLGAGWHFPVGQHYGVAPNFNVDFVNDEKVYVYGVNFTYAW